VGGKRHAFLPGVGPAGHMEAGGGEREKSGAQFCFPHQNVTIRCSTCQPPLQPFAGEHLAFVREMGMIRGLSSPHAALHHLLGRI